MELDTRPPQFVRVVTDSTASLPHTPPSGYGPAVVPLTVLTPSGPLLDGSEIVAEESLALLRAGDPLTTSQPSPEAFAVAYHYAPDVGAIVSAHLSSDLSGTYSGALAAARRVTIPVTVVDSRTTGMGLGFAALAAGRCAAAGMPAEHVAARVTEVAATAGVRFMVESLAHLKRGGRISAGMAAIGGALGVRPILEMRGGKIELAGRIRTRNAALDRLVTLAAADAAQMVAPVVAVQHFGAAERVGKLAARVRGVTGLDPLVSELSSVLGSHVGPGALAVVVADLGDHPH